MIFKDNLKLELYIWESSADQKNEVPLRWLGETAWQVIKKSSFNFKFDRY